MQNQLGLVLGVLGCILTSDSGIPDPPARQQLRKIPLLPSDGPPLALVQRGPAFWFGDFDVSGNFICDPRLRPTYSGLTGNGFPRAVPCFVSNGFVYEHRSGCLIKGTMVAGGDPGHSYGYVVPELGSMVLDLKDVGLKKPDRFIWNMPETIPAYVAERIRKYGDRPAPKAPDPPKAGTPPGWEFTPFSQLETDLMGFKMSKGKPIRHARAIGDIVEFGHLSDEGEFIPDPSLPVVSRAGILGPMKFDRFSEPRYYTLPEDTGKNGTEDVYEFRSGRLIKGLLQTTGNFVPELGSKIMDFKDYDPISDRRRIYNLPGVLKRIEKK